MRVALAWHNTWSNGRRLLAAVAGIGFAILMIFVQIGTIDSIRRASTLVYDAIDFDLILVSNHYQYLNRAGSIRTTHLAQVRIIPGVQRVAQMGYQVAPGPFLPTVMVSAVIAECGSDALKKQVLPGLADGSTVALASYISESVPRMLTYAKSWSHSTSVSASRSPPSEVSATTL